VQFKIKFVLEWWLERWLWAYQVCMLPVAPLTEAAHRTSARLPTNASCAFRGCCRHQRQTVDRYLLLPDLYYQAALPGEALLGDWWTQFLLGCAAALALLWLASAGKQPASLAYLPADRCNIRPTPWLQLPMQGSCGPKTKAEVQPWTIILNSG